MHVSGIVTVGYQISFAPVARFAIFDATRGPPEVGPNSFGAIKEKLIMRKFLSVAVFGASIAMSPMSPAFAHEGETHNLPVVSGKVTKVDEAAGKITIAHEAIPNLNMDAMTMVFKAADPAMLMAVRSGDVVQFTADKVNGQLTVTEIEKK